MMKSISFIIIDQIVALLLLIGGSYILIYYPTILSNLLAKITIIYTVLGLLCGFIWHAINRLNSFDDMDGLKDHYAGVIKQKVVAIKKNLLWRLPVIVGSILALLSLSAMQEVFSILGVVFLPIALAFAFMIIWKNIIESVYIYLHIDQLRNKFISIKKAEIARQKLIEEMKKDRQEQPLQLEQIFYEFDEEEWEYGKQYNGYKNH